MKSITKYLLILCVLISACTKPENASESDVARILGTYSFDGKVENILSVEYTDNGSEVNFVFSPIFKEKFTTVIEFSLAKSLLNKECDVDELTHMKDYQFRYEDPVWCYSELYELKEGYMWVKTSSDGKKDVYIDVLLNDGTPFTLSYTE